MHNLVYLIGRVAEINTNYIDESITIKVGVVRDVKDDEGLYQTDFFRCEISNELSKKCVEYLRKGDLIGIKGSLRNDTIDNVKILVDKCTFLSSGKESE